MSAATLRPHGLPDATPPHNGHIARYLGNLFQTGRRIGINPTHKHQQRILCSLRRHALANHNPRILALSHKRRHLEMVSAQHQHSHPRLAIIFSGICQNTHATASKNSLCPHPINNHIDHRSRIAHVVIGQKKKRSIDRDIAQPLHRFRQSGLNSVHAIGII